MSSISLGAHIEQLREKRGLSQRGLALKTGLSNSTINRIEKDEVHPDPTSLVKIAKALEADVNELMLLGGYSTMPEQFVVMARKTGDLSDDAKQKVYDALNSTIDDVLAKLEGENRGQH